MNLVTVGSDAYEVDRDVFMKRFNRIAVWSSDGADWWFAFQIPECDESNDFWLLRVNEGGGWALVLDTLSLRPTKRIGTTYKGSLKSITLTIIEARRDTWLWDSSDDEDDPKAELPQTPVSANNEAFRAAVATLISANK